MIGRACTGKMTQTYDLFVDHGTAYSTSCIAFFFYIIEGTQHDSVVVELLKSKCKF